MSITAEEIATQPECWERASGIIPEVASALPATGEKVAVVGCGTSWFMAQSYAVLRERAGLGVTDAFAASEFPYGRDYDRIVAITRSGTTTEVLDLLRTVRGTVRTTAVIGDPATPIVDLVDDLVVLDFADEKSVVQTRFATSVLALLRTHLGEDITPAVADARRAIAEELSPSLLGAEQFSFLGTGWAYGIALEAGLKMREAAGAWTEAYPAMEYRHGPISITGPNRIAWVFGDLPEGLDGDVARTGGTLEASGTDPLADLIRVQRLAVAIAEAQGLNPDTPRNLTRSVVLS
ncbi:sugar isomerase [Streptomyces sp. H10-C2]|uniref:SIS domain-containing protein n=1 Tax=unclassified Streptomyces TaxID=2593676 RepID=UPI0024B99E4C|nr:MULTISPECIES: sugar isomerase [unclassified Streptomyces]MDJ0341656.1 sugar isomerase [Streptomyces sp. PH10-H1]MDJ0369036.1 sugar isomerase [Streptomyces sp. H10-C2]